MKKNWKNMEDGEEDGLPYLEKMGRKSQRKKEQIHLADEFVLSAERFAKLPEKAFYARVVEVQKRYAFIAKEPRFLDLKTHDVWLGTIARRHLQAARLERNVVVVGDRVICCAPSDGRSPSADLPAAVIEHRMERTSACVRLDPIRPDRSHVLASNWDQLVITSSFLYPKVKWGLIDRFLTLAEEQEKPAVIILNKSDLLEKIEDAAFKEEVETNIAEYRRLGYQVQVISAIGLKQDKEGRKALSKVFKDKISLICGHSGVGKSSVTNLFKPELIQDVEADAILKKGRHTTTYASFLKLGTGGYMIDTPGIRSFAIGERSAIDLASLFPELRPHLGGCQFRECRHIDEPDCKIREKVLAGEISRRRYDSFLSLLTGASQREGRISRGEFEEDEAEYSEEFIPSVQVGESSYEESAYDESESDSGEFR